MVDTGSLNGRYGEHLVPLSRMLNDNLVHDHIQCHPPSFIHYVNNLGQNVSVLVPEMT